MPSELATQRKLIFINLLNGVSVAQVAQAFHRQSEKEVMDDFRYVALKIKSYAFQRGMPYIALETVKEAQGSKIMILGILEKINLDVLPVFSSVRSNAVDNFDQLQGVLR
jgi:hypothetical protein